MNKNRYPMRAPEEYENRVQTIIPLLRNVLELLGEDVEREGLVKTPERWAKALLDYTKGMEQDPKQHLQVIFKLDEENYPNNAQDMIIVHNIQFTSTCEHHLAPFRGTAHIAYIPNPESKTITGLSKLSRVVELFAKRLQVQERMTQQITKSIEDHLNPAGVIAVTQATHYCMVQRGVEQTSTSTTSTSRRGIFLTKPELEGKFQDYLRIELDNSKF
jgi:GTP cyclohydrolase I